MKTIRKLDVARKIIYQNCKQALRKKQEEIAYSVFDGYEIATTHIFNKGYETCKWSTGCGIKLLETYTNKIDAIAGHLKWCMRGESC